MALKHAQPMEVINLHMTDGAAETVVSSSLLKTPRLQLMRVILAEGQALPEHRVPGEITVQCFSGEVDVGTPSRTCRLGAGTLVMLPAAEPHWVRARLNSILLVTILHP